MTGDEPPHETSGHRNFVELNLKGETADGKMFGEGDDILTM